MRRPDKPFMGTYNWHLTTWTDNTDMLMAERDCGSLEPDDLGFLGLTISSPVMLGESHTLCFLIYSMCMTCTTLSCYRRVHNESYYNGLLIVLQLLTGLHPSSSIPPEPKAGLTPCKMLVHTGFWLSPPSTAAISCLGHPGGRRGI